MRQLATAVVLGALAVAALGAAGASAGVTTKLGVAGTEFNLQLSRAKVDPGPAEVEFHNAGEDPHNLKIKRRGGERRYSIPELEPGAVGEVDLRFKRDSRYVFWCSTLNGVHRSQGMEATLRVRGN